MITENKEVKVECSVLGNKLHSLLLTGKIYFKNYSSL